MWYTKNIKINETNISTEDKYYYMNEEQWLKNFVLRITNQII